MVDILEATGGWFLISKSVGNYFGHASRFILILQIDRCFDGKLQAIGCDFVRCK